MIFASVGSMLPFERFVKAIDEWAARNEGEPVFIQIGDGRYQPKHADWAQMLPHAEYREKLSSCDLFVAHVGMGSILQGLELRKQMLLMPRCAKWREITTDHQIHTAERFRHHKGLRIVDDVHQLKREMSELTQSPLQPTDGISATAPKPMLDAVRQYLTRNIR